MVGRDMAPVALATSRKQAKRFSDQYDRAMAGQASDKALAKVLLRVQEAHGVTGVVMKAGRPQPGPRCGTCGRFAKMAGAHFCTKCGAQFAGVVKDDGQAAGHPRCAACGRLGVAGAEKCAGCGYKLGVAVRGESGEQERSYTCPGCAKKVHQDRASCPFCGALRGAAKSSAVPVPLTDAEQVHLAAILSKAQSADPERRLAGLGELVAKVGPQMAASIMADEMVSPQQFARAFVARNRAPLSAPAGAHPRIPVASHVITSDDFRRPPLDEAAGHQRPPQALDRLNELLEPGGGQAAYYRQSPGIAPSDPYGPDAGAPNSSTLAPGLARANAARGAFANPPAPGAARPW